MTALGAARGHLDKIKDETEYYPHQTEGVRDMAKRRSFLLADEMGLGKSLQSLTVAAIDWELDEAERGLIVSPASLKWNWGDEIDKFTNFSYTILNGSPKKRSEQIGQYADESVDFLICNYEQVIPHLAEFNKLRFDIGIFDEAHYLKNRSAKRTKASHGLLLKRRFLLTGSPVLNNVEELWGLLHMIDPGQFDSFWRFVNRYALRGGFKGKEIVGIVNKEELNTIVGQYMVRRLKKDVLDLPDKQYITIRLELLPEQLKLYKQAVEDLMIDIPGNPDPMELENALTKMLRLKQICGTTACLIDEDHSSKLDEAEEMVQEMIDNGENVVVFTQFRDVQKAFVNRLLKRKLRVYQLHGDVKMEERQGVVKEWAAHTPAAMVAMLQVAGVGLNMTAASKCIFLDKLYVPKLNEQAEDRLHRIGASTTQPIQIYELIMRNTVENRIESILRRKRKLFDSIVEETDWKRALWEAMLEEEED